MARSVNVAIIGAGPAGIAAGIFLKRAGLSPLLLEKAVAGGLLRSANLVENYPGFPEGISGRNLVRRFASQMRRMGIEITRAEVNRASMSKGAFAIQTDSTTYRAESLIIATGTRPRDVKLRGARALGGTRFFTELTDVPVSLRKGKRAVVLGGGDAAFDYAIDLRESGDEVTILSRSEPRCLPLLRERARKAGARLRIGCEVTSASPIPKDGGVVCEIVGGPTEKVSADFILMACGRTPNIEFLDPSLRRIVAKGHPPRTSIPGLFLAGDVARGDHRQTGIAVGDGVRAAMMVQEFLMSKEGCG